MSHKVVLLYPLLITIENDAVKEVQTPSTSDCESYQQFFPELRFDNLTKAMKYARSKAGEVAWSKSVDQMQPQQLVNAYEKAFCKTCRQNLPVGEAIYWMRGVGSWHIACYKPETK